LIVVLFFIFCLLCVRHRCWWCRQFAWNIWKRFVDSFIK